MLVRFPEIQVYNSTWFADYPIKQQNFLISANSFLQRAGIAALSFSNLAVRVSFVAADLDADPVVSKMTQEDADERVSSHRSTLFCPSHMITDLW